MNISASYIERDLHDSGTLKELSDRFDLDIIVSQDVNAQKMSQFGNVIQVGPPTRLRFELFDNLRNLISIMKWEPVLGPLGRQYWNSRKPGSFRGLLTKIVALHRLRLGRPFAWLAKGWLAKTLHNDFPKIERRPDAVLIPTIMRTMVADDMMRWAKANNVPSLLLQMSFDTFNIKSPTDTADFYAVWGEHAWFILHLVHGVPPFRIKVVGSPRFEIYADLPVKEKVREVLQLPQNTIIILFCGAVQSDTEFVLSHLNAAISSGALPNNCHIAFKPHPKAKTPAARGYFDETNSYEHVTLIDGENENYRHWPDLQFYKSLMAAADAMITPYSTMGLEGAICGLPVMCTPFLDRTDANWYQSYFIHLRLFYEKPWAINCLNMDQFVEATTALVALAKDPQTSEMARGSAHEVVYTDDQPYSKRLSDTLVTLIESGKVAHDFSALSRHVK